jgi:tRNA(Arg) A34 adenosine deaminase TadA
MLTKRLAVLLALYIQAKRRSKPVALLLDARLEVLASAEDMCSSPCEAATAVVNLLRICGQSLDLEGKFIACSAPPTVMDTGMCRLTGVKAIWTLSAAGLAAWQPADGKGALISKAEQDAAPQDPALAGWMAEALRVYTGNGSHDDLVAAMERCPDAALLRGMQSWARQVTAVPGYAPPPPPPAQGPLCRPGDNAGDAFWLRTAKQLTGIIHGASNTNPAVQKMGHNIGCILVSAEGAVLAWGVNTNVNNPTRHAETNCVHMFQFLNRGQALPAGATLYTTLQSCYMCSGMIKHAAGANFVRVVYGERDKVANSVLTVGEGAREESADVRRLLGVGQRMLAAARWERLRRTLSPAQDGNFDEDKLQLLTGPTREILDGHLRQLQDRKLAAQKQAVSAKVTALNKAPYESPDARKEAMSQFNASPDKRLTEIAAGVPYFLRLARLSAARSAMLNIETEGRQRVGVGAPVLLMTESARKQLAPVERDTPIRPEAEREENLAKDLNTARHAYQLLAQVRAMAEAYRTM